MTRLEKIFDESIKFWPYDDETSRLMRNSFLKGATWADSHPHRPPSDELNLATIALKSIESGEKCSACSCTCHKVAKETLLLLKK